MDEREELIPSLVAAMNVLQDGTTYAGRHVGNSPEFMPLDNILNRYILNCLCFHCVLSRFVLDREGNDN